MNLNVNAVYVMHYKPLAERLVHMNNMLTNQGIDFSVFDSEPENNLHEYFIDDFEIRKQKLSLFPGNQPSKNVKTSEISLAYKHVLALEKMVNDNVDVALFLEDDAILCDNFSSVANEYLRNTPDDWDMIFPGNGCNLRIHQSRIRQGQVAYKKDHPSTKCTDSYFIKLDAAKKLLTTIKPFHIAIDWELNFQLKHHNFNVYWYEPYIVQQGSTGAGTGIWRSAIQ